MIAVLAYLVMALAGAMVVWGLVTAAADKPPGRAQLLFAAGVEVVTVGQTIVAFVAAGIGVALVPEPVRSLALEGVVYRSLSDVDQRTDLVLVTRVDEPSPAARAVARLVLPG